MKDITEVDGVCLPDYVMEKTNNLKNEMKYYHSKFGVIIFKNNN